MNTSLNYTLFAVNYFIFTTYYLRHVIFKTDENIFNITDEIKKRINQLYQIVFMDTALLCIYFLNIFEKIPIGNEWIYYVIMVLFVCVSLYNIRFKETKKFLFIQLFNVVIINIYTIGQDPLFAFIVRYSNNFLNVILLVILGYYYRRLEKEEFAL